MGKKLKLTKRRIIVLIIAAILLLLIIFGLCKLFKTVFSKEKVYGNISNKGLAVADGNTVFYNKYNKGIYKVKGKNETSVVDEIAYCLTLYNNKLYYITISETSTKDLVSVDKDGQNYQKIKTLNTPLEKFYIENNYLYYYKSANGSSGISKLSLDNEEEHDITAAIIKDFVLDKGVIYFSDDVGFLHSVDVSGQNRKEITHDYGVGKIQIMGKWIYFYDSYEKALCKIKKDGSSKSTVATFVNNETFNVTSKYIYYLDKTNSQISRCDLKGKKSNAIVSLEMINTKINVVDGILYYLDKSKDGTQPQQMFRVKTNGKATSEIVY